MQPIFNHLDIKNNNYSPQKGFNKRFSNSGSSQLPRKFIAIRHTWHDNLSASFIENVLIHVVNIWKTHYIMFQYKMIIDFFLSKNLSAIAPKPFHKL